MCFSATASFTLGAVLVSTGIFCSTIAHKSNKNYFLFALIPLFFGIQQGIEGTIWWALKADYSYFAYLLGYFYLFFAFYFWPFYIPTSLYFIEKGAWHKKMMLIFAITGTILGLVMYVPLLLNLLPFSVTILDHSIHYAVYQAGILIQIYSVLYILIITVSLVYASNPKIKIFGVLALVSSLISYWSKVYTFTSVWCFFAAILSAYIVYIVCASRK